MMKTQFSKASIGTVVGLSILLSVNTSIARQINIQPERVIRGARLDITTTPSGDVDRIYIARDNEVQCLDRRLDRVVWTSLVPYGTVDVGAIVFDKTVIYVSGDMSTVRALDRNSGSLKWTASIQSAHIAVGGKSVFLSTSTGMGVQALNAENGKKLWRYEPGGPGSIYQILYANGKIYTDQYILDAANGELLKRNSSEVGVMATEGGSIFWATSGGKVEAFRAKSNKNEWKAIVSKSTRPIALSVNSRLVFFAGYYGMPFSARSGILKAFDVNDGHLAWETPIETKAGGLQPSPIASDQDAVYLLSPASESTTRLANLNAVSGKESWSVELKGKLEGPPLIVGGIIYITDGPDVIYEVDKASGKVVTRDQLPNRN